MSKIITSTVIISAMKVGIFYHWFAHYRRPIIREMTTQLSPEFDFIADDKSLEPAMEVMTTDDFTELFEHNHDCRFHKIRNLNLAGFIWQTGAIRRVMSGEYDLVVFLGEFRILSTWLAVLVARLRNIRVYYWSHGVYGNESWLTLKIRLLFYKLADGMFLYGNYSRRLLIDRGFSPDHLHVVFNSLDHRRQVELRQEISNERIESIRRLLFPATYSDPLLIFVGRITLTKKLDQLMVAFEQLNKQSSVNLLIVGDGPALPTLKQIAIDTKVDDRIQFVGSCHEELVLAEYLTAADICVSPGNVGLLAMHSLVYGTPVITHNDKKLQMPEFEAIIDGKTGGFFEIDDTTSLVNTLTHWLTRVRTGRDRLRSDCHSVIDRFYNPSYQCEVFREVFSGQVPPHNLVNLPDNSLIESNAKENSKK